MYYQKLLGLDPEEKRIMLNELPQGALPVYDRLDQSKPVHIACRSESGKKKTLRTGQKDPFVADDLRVDVVMEGDQVLLPLHDVFVKSVKKIVQSFLDQFPNEKVYISFNPINSDFDVARIAFCSCQGELAI